MSLNCSCGSPTADGIFLCTSCADLLSYKLAEVDSVVGDLVRAVPRASLTASYGERVSASGSLHAPLPINDTALDAHIALDKYLMVTCIELAKACGPLTNRTSSGLATYLLTNIGTLRRQDWAGTVHATLAGLLRKAENVTHVAERKVFGGTCAEDGTDLYATQGTDTARCRTCGTTYQVAAWQAHARTAKEYHIGTPAELSRALSNPAYGIEVTLNQICMWAKRGKLTRANEEADENGEPLRPTYRLRDVLDLNAKRRPIDGKAA